MPRVGLEDGVERVGGLVKAEASGAEGVVEAIVDVDVSFVVEAEGVDDRDGW